MTAVLHFLRRRLVDSVELQVRRMTLLCEPHLNAYGVLFLFYLTECEEIVELRADREGTISYPLDSGCLGYPTDMTCVWRLCTSASQVTWLIEGSST